MKLLRYHHSRFVEGSHNSRLMVKINRNLCIFKCIFSMRSILNQYSWVTNIRVLRSYTIFEIYPQLTSQTPVLERVDFLLKWHCPRWSMNASGTQQWNSEIQSSSDYGFRLYFLVNRLNKMFSISWKIPKPL